MCNCYQICILPSVLRKSCEAQLVVCDMKTPRDPIIQGNYRRTPQEETRLRHMEKIRQVLCLGPGRALAEPKRDWRR